MLVDITAHIVVDATILSSMNPSAVAALNAASNKALIKAYRCSIQGCKVSEESPKLRCSSDTCNKMCHTECYIRKILDGSIKRTHFISNAVPDNTLDKAACSVKCYRKCYQKLYVDIQSRNVPWNKDGKNGPDDPNNSEAILYEWLTEPGNYAKFRAPPNGKTKHSFCELIADKLRRAEVVKERDAGAVKSKIESIETAFKACHDWANETGQGVLERDGQVVFEEACRKKFPHYFDLIDIFGDRAMARPCTTTDDVSIGLGSTSSSGEYPEEAEGLSDTAEAIVVRVQNENHNETCVTSCENSIVSVNQTGDQPTTPAPTKKNPKKRKTLLSKKEKSSSKRKRRMEESPPSKWEQTIMDMQLQQINLERKRFAQAQKQEELELGVKMLETYRKMRRKGVSKAMIVATFPQMEKLAKADTSVDEVSFAVDRSSDDSGAESECSSQINK